MSSTGSLNEYNKNLIDLSISDYYHAHSVSMGYLGSSDQLRFFLFGSSFYVELSGFAEQSKVRIGALTVLLRFDGHHLDGASLQTVIFGKDDVVCSMREHVSFNQRFSIYGDTATYALKISPIELEALEFGGRLRLYFFSDSIQPNIVSFSKLQLLKTASSVDTEYQMGDQRRAMSQSRCRDGLAGHRQGGWSPLHFAAHWDHQDWLSAMLRDGVSPDVAEANGATALHRAADMGHLLIASKLLEAGASPNVVDRNLEETPLDCAIRKSNSAVAKLIRSHGGSTNGDHRSSESPCT